MPSFGSDSSRPDREGTDVPAAIGRANRLREDDPACDSEQKVSIVNDSSPMSSDGTDSDAMGVISEQVKMADIYRHENVGFHNTCVPVFSDIKLHSP